MDGYADLELVGALFDGDDDDTDALDELIRQSGRWPVLRMGAGHADFAVVCWHGYDPEGGYDFLVLPDGSGWCVSVAAREGHGYGPGLSWPEAERLVERGRLGTPAQRLLLLLPALGDADTPEEAVGLVAAALLTEPAGHGSTRSWCVTTTTPFVRQAGCRPRICCWSPGH